MNELATTSRLEHAEPLKHFDLKISEPPTEEFLQTLCNFTGACKGIVFKLLPDTPLRIEQYFPHTNSMKKESWLRQLSKACPGKTVCVAIEDAGSTYYGQKPNDYLAIIACPQEQQFLALYQKNLSAKAKSVFMEQLHCFFAARQLPQTLRHIKTQNENVESLTFAAKLHNKLLRIKHFSDAGTIICRELASAYNAEEVFFGICRRQHQVKLIASNYNRRMNGKGPEAASISELMEECCDQDLEILFPPVGEQRGICHQHRLFYRKREGHGILSIPVRNPQQQVIGCITLIRPQPFTFNDCRILRNAIDTVTPFLDELRNSSFLRQLLIRTPLGLFKPLFSRNFIEFKIAAFVFALLIICAAMVKTVDSIDAPFTIKAQVSRTISAPFDSFLEKILLARGDRVIHKESVLAHLETVELNLRKSELSLKIASLVKVSEKELSDGNFAKRHIAKLELEALQSEQNRIKYYLDNAVIRCGIDGVVLDSPFEERVGSPVKRGEILFTVADLNSLYAEMLIPDIEMHSLKIGQKGELAAVTEPQHKIAFSIVKILPLAEKSEAGRIFRVTLKLAEKPAFIRPGVEGIAKIHLRRCSHLRLYYSKIVRFIQGQFWF